MSTETRFTILSFEMWKHSLGKLFDQAMRTFPSDKFNEWCEEGRKLRLPMEGNERNRPRGGLCENHGLETGIEAAMSKKKNWKQKAKEAEELTAEYRARCIKAEVDRDALRSALQEALRPLIEEIVSEEVDNAVSGLTIN